MGLILLMPSVYSKMNLCYGWKMNRAMANNGSSR